MDNDKIEYELEHARANYWILTAICGVFLYLFINKFMLLEFDAISGMYALILIFSGYFAIKLSAYINKLKDINLRDG
ncbi:hypothetical protein [Vibrio sp. dhg]|uniref:hypothetical protein n=1 Tax=Vibrio sp. dhg TaxID=2163016 RepID=UPI000E4CFC91|nr:hypothetical protein [Vibrio sp. dhg]AXT73734.1 hypothetical protein DBX26_22690 [Vibrio sp. dhg]